MIHLENSKLRDTLLNKGILQEVNRVFFHPLGMALTIIYFEETERTELKLQYTENPEGYVFDFLDRFKMEMFREFSNNKFDERQECLGFTIQTRDFVEQDKNYKRNIKTNRLEILFKFLKMFIYDMQKKFLKHHEEQDKDNQLHTVSVLESFLFDSLQEKDWVSVANYSMMIQFYNELEKEISELKIEEEEENNG